MVFTLRSICIRVTGFKPARYFQWRAVVKSEARRVGWRSVLTGMAKQLTGLGRVSKSRWRLRYRYGCRQCPIYDKARHACRDTHGMGLGCGCWMPGKSLVLDRACWVRNLGDRAHGFD